jgi:cytochrome c-type biogenesis protein CcmH/NrfG
MQPGIHALIIAAFAATVVTGAFAAPDPPPDPDKDKDKKVEQARQAIEGGEWLRAEGLLRAAVAEDPRNAESHNLYAYSIRKGPSPRMELVFRHYNEALRLRPSHRGAHEYLGEAYLMTGNLAKAREHLAILERLCGACDEQGKLAQAISTAERQQATK